MMMGHRAAVVVSAAAALACVLAVPAARAAAAGAGARAGAGVVPLPANGTHVSTAAADGGNPIFLLSNPFDAPAVALVTVDCSQAPAQGDAQVEAQAHEVQAQAQAGAGAAWCTSPPQWWIALHSASPGPDNADFAWDTAVPNRCAFTAHARVQLGAAGGPDGSLHLAVARASSSTAPGGGGGGAGGSPDATFAVHVAVIRAWRFGETVTFGGAGAAGASDSAGGSASSSGAVHRAVYFTPGAWLLRLIIARADDGAQGSATGDWALYIGTPPEANPFPGPAWAGPASGQTVVRGSEARFASGVVDVDMSAGANNCTGLDQHAVTLTLVPPPGPGPALAALAVFSVKGAQGAFQKVVTPALLHYNASSALDRLPGRTMAVLAPFNPATAAYCAASSVDAYAAADVVHTFASAAWPAPPTPLYGGTVDCADYSQGSPGVGVWAWTFPAPSVTPTGTDTAFAITARPSSLAAADPTGRVATASASASASATATATATFAVFLTRLLWLGHHDAMQVPAWRERQGAFAVGFEVASPSQAPILLRLVVAGSSGVLTQATPASRFAWDGLDSFAGPRRAFSDGEPLVLGNIGPAFAPATSFSRFFFTVRPSTPPLGQGSAGEGDDGFRVSTSAFFLLGDGDLPAAAVPQGLPMSATPQHMCTGLFRVAPPNASVALSWWVEGQAAPVRLAAGAAFEALFSEAPKGGMVPVQLSVAARVFVSAAFVPAALASAEGQQQPMEGEGEGESGLGSAPASVSTSTVAPLLLAQQVLTRAPEQPFSLPNLAFLPGLPTCFAVPVPARLDGGDPDASLAWVMQPASTSASASASAAHAGGSGGRALAAPSLGSVHAWLTWVPTAAGAAAPPLALGGCGTATAPPAGSRAVHYSGAAGDDVVVALPRLPVGGGTLYVGVTADEQVPMLTALATATTLRAFPLSTGPAFSCSGLPAAGLLYVLPGPAAARAVRLRAFATDAAPAPTSASASASTPPSFDFAVATTLGYAAGTYALGSDATASQPAAPDVLAQSTLTFQQAAGASVYLRLSGCTSNFALMLDAAPGAGPVPPPAVSGEASWGAPSQLPATPAGSTAGRLKFTPPSSCVGQALVVEVGGCDQQSVAVWVSRDGTQGADGGTPRAASLFVGCSFTTGPTPASASGSGDGNMTVGPALTLTGEAGFVTLDALRPLQNATVRLTCTQPSPHNGDDTPADADDTVLYVAAALLASVIGIVAGCVLYWRMLRRGSRSGGRGWRGLATGGSSGGGGGGLVSAEARHRAASRTSMSYMRLSTSAMDMGDGAGSGSEGGRRGGGRAGEQIQMAGVTYVRR